MMEVIQYCWKLIVAPWMTMESRCVDRDSSHFIAGYPSRFRWLIALVALLMIGLATVGAVLRPSESVPYFAFFAIPCVMLFIHVVYFRIRFNQDELILRRFLRPTLTVPFASIRDVTINAKRHEIHLLMTGHPQLRLSQYLRGVDALIDTIPSEPRRL